MQHIQDYDFKGKRALIRVDFNVPMDASCTITDDTRIREALPTIQKVLNDGGAVVLLSHLGRPKPGQCVDRYSLRHIVPHLSQLLGQSVAFYPSCVSHGIFIPQCQPGSVLLLENSRFQKGELTNDAMLADAMANLGDVYINDAWATMHRSHASTAGVARRFEDKMAGYLVQKEVETFGQVMHDLKRPYTAIIGGAKISDKIEPLEHLLDLADNLLIGGGLANTFQKAMGGALGNSMVEEDQVQIAKKLLLQAKEKGKQLLLPAEVVVAPSLQGAKEAKVVAAGEVPIGWMALDIGPQAEQAFSDVIKASQTILWCGPMGAFETAGFQEGSKAVAAAMAQATTQGACSIVGGGDSIAAVNTFGYAEQMSYLSTGGGALLAYMSGMSLPGVVALE
jgi:phosphoglycerate kinase